MDRVRYVDPPEVLERFHAHLDLVDILAARLLRTLQLPAHGPVQLDDLISAGREGLLGAARRYDASHGVQFRAFAHYRIKGAMMDQIRQLSPLPWRTHQRLVAAEAAARLNEGYGEYAVSEPTDDLDERRAEKALAGHVDAVVAGAVLRFKIDTARAETSSAQVSDPEALYERAETLRLLERALETLDEYEAQIVKRHYFFEHRLEDIGADLEISKSWASRLHAKALRRLARCLQPPEEPEPTDS